MSKREPVEPVEQQAVTPLEEWKASVVRAKIKGVFSTYKTLRDGTRRTYWYHRNRRRLHGEPGSPEFIADLAAAEKLIRDRLAGTFNNLVRLFTLSTEFEKTAASTRAEYRRMLTKAEAEFGDMPIAARRPARPSRIHGLA